MKRPARFTIAWLAATVIAALVVCSAIAEASAASAAPNLGDRAKGPAPRNTIGPLLRPPGSRRPAEPGSRLGLHNQRFAQHGRTVCEDPPFCGRQGPRVFSLLVQVHGPRSQPWNRFWAGGPGASDDLPRPRVGFLGERSRC